MQALLHVGKSRLFQTIVITSHESGMTGVGMYLTAEWITEINDHDQGRDGTCFFETWGRASGASLGLPARCTTGDLK